MLRGEWWLFQAGEGGAYKGSRDAERLNSGYWVRQKQGVWRAGCTTNSYRHQLSVCIAWVRAQRNVESRGHLWLNFTNRINDLSLHMYCKLFPWEGKRKTNLTILALGGKKDAVIEKSCTIQRIYWTPNFFKTINCLLLLTVFNVKHCKIHACIKWCRIISCIQQGIDDRPDFSVVCIIYPSFGPR